MKNLKFSELMETANQKDIFDFMDSLTNGVFLQNKNADRVSVAGYYVEDDAEVDTMETVEIYFQTWEPGESGKGSFFVWTSYRAKNFSCSNQSISAKNWSRDPAKSWILKK